MRAMVAETQLHPTDFILPLFIADDLGEHGERREIPSMPGAVSYTHLTLPTKA